MADSRDPKRPTIPDWQKNYVKSAAAPNSAPSKQPSTPNDAAPSEAGLMERAKRWLQDTSIRDAPRERKAAFLAAKGMQDDDIQKLLSIPDNSEQESEMKIVHDTASSTSPSETSSPTLPDTQTHSSTKSTAPSRDVPPIITYPEFLLRPEKPPPLVTFRRLAYATYGFAALTALTYGASRYLVQPMLESLTSARHELADTALQNLDKFNSKLESNVSHVSYLSSSGSLKVETGGSNDDDGTESVDSDPTELFHRDVATQTLPLKSRNSSLDSSTFFNQIHQEANPTSSQSNRLSLIATSLASLLASTSPSTTPPNPTDSLKSTVEDLQTYLDNLQFSNNSFNASSYDHIYPGLDVQKSSSKKNKTGEDDEAEKFKAEIRAVKGALLSSRTFPAGRKPIGSGSGIGNLGSR